MPVISYLPLASAPPPLPAIEVLPTVPVRVLPGIWAWVSEERQEADRSRARKNILTPRERTEISWACVLRMASKGARK